MPVADAERACLLVTTLLVHALLDGAANAETFTLGYITGSKRRPGDWEYSRPGLQISGAITFAVDEVNNSGVFLPLVNEDLYSTESLSPRG